MSFNTKTIEDTELVYSLLREKYPERQIDIEYNDNTKEYILKLTDKKYIEDPEVALDVKVKVIYGDSCTKDSGLLLRDPQTNLVHIETFQSIFDESKKVEYPGFKMFDKNIRLEKEYSTTNYQVWTDLGWQNIKKVIRHKCKKKIYKILTHTGCVKVTEDHSLLNENKEVLKPTECVIGNKLLQSYPTSFNSSVNTISKDKAFIYGSFFGDGSCCRYECPSGIKYSWTLNNADNNLKILLQNEYPDSKPIIYDTLNSSGVYKDFGRVAINNPKKMVEEYRHKFYDSDKYKKVPTEILNSSNEIIQSFFDGYKLTSDFEKNFSEKDEEDEDEDGCRKDKENIDNKGQIGSAGLYYLMKKLGYKVSLNIRDDKEKMFRLTITKKLQIKIPNKIKKIELQESTDDFVYDLETDCGRFQAGVGDIIVKNTDSIFISMKYNRKDFINNRKDSFKLATICGNNITEMFNRKPIDLEFEKVFQPFILLTKKRYIGKKFEDTRDPLKLKTITNSGIAITRRDYCKMVKDCYKEVIDCIVDDNNNNDSNVEKSVNIYKNYVDRLDNYQIDVDDLIVSKTLAKSYSCSLCKIKSEWIHLKCDEKKCNKESPINSPRCIKCKIPFKCQHKFSLIHVQLAKKMLSRKDEANINDRIPYIFIETDDKSVAKSDLGEDPVYAKKHGLKYNRSCYLESMAKPILAFFRVVLKEYQDELDDLINYTNDKLESYGAKKLKPSDYKEE